MFLIQFKFPVFPAPVAQNTDELPIIWWFPMSAEQAVLVWNQCSPSALPQIPQTPFQPNSPLCAGSLSFCFKEKIEATLQNITKIPFTNCLLALCPLPFSPFFLSGSNSPVTLSQLILYPCSASMFEFFHHFKSNPPPYKPCLPPCLHLLENSVTPASSSWALPENSSDMLVAVSLIPCQPKFTSSLTAVYAVGIRAAAVVVGDFREGWGGWIYFIPSPLQRPRPP